MILKRLIWDVAILVIITYLALSSDKDPITYYVYYLLVRSTIQAYLIDVYGSAIVGLMMLTGKIKLNGRSAQSKPGQAEHEGRMQDPGASKED